MIMYLVHLPTTPTPRQPYPHSPLAHSPQIHPNNISWALFFFILFSIYFCNVIGPQFIRRIFILSKHRLRRFKTKSCSLLNLYPIILVGFGKLGRIFISSNHFHYFFLNYKHWLIRLNISLTSICFIVIDERKRESYALLTSSTYCTSTH